MAPSKKDISALRWSFTSEKKRRKLVDAACNLLRLWPETAELLQLAQDKGITIGFNDELLGADTDGLVRRDRKTGVSRIELKPMRDPADIAIPLIHELRHLWQAEVLGLPPEKSGLGEKDAATALLLTRVKEADAFAFTNLMIARINHAQEDFPESEALTQKLLKDSGKTALDAAQQEQVDDFLAAKISGRLAAEQQQMAQDFCKALTWLDSYDRETLSAYHHRYAPPFGDAQAHMTEKDGHVIGLADIRKVLRTGTLPNMPPYLDTLDDKAFVAMVMKDVEPAIAGAVSAVDAFEKASRKPSQETALALDTTVRKALAAVPKTPR